MTGPDAFLADPESQILLRGRVVLPISGPPISDGGIVVTGNRIRAVGRWSDLGAACTGSLDLGDVILMPGLVNAHCHLDYTHMAGMFPPPRSFPDWIKQITTTKAQWGYSEFADSWLCGARMLVGTGTTTVGDIETAPELLPEVWQATPLRVCSFLEMTGVRSRRQPEAILGEAIEHIERLPAGRCRAWLSPHAPYSTRPELLGLAARAARENGWRLCTHVAESALEYEMFARGSGEMFDWIRRSERDMSDCGLGSPVEQLHRSGLLGENLLAVHANYLGKRDASLLGRRRVSVAHCARSHAYFRHEPFPLSELTRARVNICLGTDSLASVFKTRREMVELNMFQEMQIFAAAHPEVPARAILKMATLNGARSLGMAGKIGELSPDGFADLIAIRFNGEAADAYDAVLNYTGKLAASMIDGKWAIQPVEAEEGSDGPPRLDSALASCA